MWSEHWNTHQAALLRYVGYLVADDAQAAEDIVQETAIRLWQNPEVLDDEVRLGAWLRTVARNLVVDRHRRRGVRPAEVALASNDEIASPDVADRTEALACVTDALATLGPLHRTVVFEFYVRDRSLADVATDLGVPVGTVKSRCHTALRRLREMPLPLCDLT